MPLQKQGANITFGQGVQTKTDPFQVPAGQLLSLQNAVFNTSNLLQKRNGFPDLTILNAEVLSLSTLNNNLLASGKSLYALSASTNTWVNEGLVEPIRLSNQALVRTNFAQVISDAILAENNVLCTAFVENNNTYYQITDYTTGQLLVPQQQIAGAKNPRVFSLNQWFIILFGRNSSGAKLSYIAISKANPNINMGIQDLSTLLDTDDSFFDAVSDNETLYAVFNASDVGGATRVIALNTSLVASTSQVVATSACDKGAITLDETTSTPTVYVFHYLDSAPDLRYRIYSSNLLPLLVDTSINSVDTILNVTAQVKNGTGTVYYEVENTYSYGSELTNFIQKNTIDFSGTVGSDVEVVRSVGLASKAFTIEDNVYMLSTYSNDLQPSYFLINSDGAVISRLAYSNGFGYYSQLSNVTVFGLKAFVPYLRRTIVKSVNRAQGATSVAGIFALTGVDYASFEFAVTQYNAETAMSQHYTGGMLWQYDGRKPVENGFHLWPDYIDATPSTGTGSMTAQQYYYQFIYEWTDANGITQRSAPSLPISLNLTGMDNTVTLNVNTLRLTQKTGVNTIRIVGYRWSAAQQTYYQFTSVTTPTANNTTVDSVSIVDELADSSIIGNSILYTTGGVVENIAAPANDSITLYKNRLMVVDSENKNTIWYSKQLIENEPVEMSDLFTIYVPPSKDAPGGLTAISTMDDKLICFKRQALQYLVGIGPDNTGAQNDFTDPVLITSTVGSTNQRSIVSTPIGLMFQSDKGIWLLGRDLQTSYIGAPVQAYNNFEITSAVVVPGTNQVRFTLDNRQVLMYDYFEQQWGIFTNIAAVDSVIYNNSHTFIDESGNVRQEQIGSYLDGSVPVVMQFTTAWLKLTDLQGFQRAYFAYLLSNYKTPHKLQISISYDYNPASQQIIIITPDNYSAPWGDDVVWGSGELWGGQSQVEQWRLFFNKQKCQSIQISVQEIFDPSFNTVAGAGLTFSGINLVVGGKKGYPTLPAKNSAG